MLEDTPASIIYTHDRRKLLFALGSGAVLLPLAGLAISNVGQSMATIWQAEQVIAPPEGEIFYPYISRTRYKYVRLRCIYKHIMLFKMHHVSLSGISSKKDNFVFTSKNHLQRLHLVT